jgi:N-acetylglucosaminyl-diphospho-decaprenol L-rhamnosyltransferase
MRARLFNEDGSNQQNFKTNVFKRECNRSIFTVPEGNISVEYLSGAVMLLRMSCFRNQDFFDPDIFLFYEDDDICLACKGRGYELIFTPFSRAIHLMDQSSPQTYTHLY